MKTILTIKQQKAWLENNAHNAVLTHNWSSRGYGNSKFSNAWNDVLGKRGGCGYDRRGAVLADVMLNLFGNELVKLAKKTVKTKQGKSNRKSTAFYGLWLNDKGGIILDGACGFDCMITILNAVGFSLVYKTESNGNSVTGWQVFTVEPITKQQREWLRRNF